MAVLGDLRKQEKRKSEYSVFHPSL